MTAGGGIVARPVGGELLRILLSAEQDGGALGVVEMHFEAGAVGPPLHVHPTHGEGFYVLEGELTVQLGADVVTGGPGTWAFAPRDLPHTLAKHGSVPARLLALFAPGGFERRFARMLAEQEGPAAVAELAELAEAERATQVVGPPLPVPDADARPDRAGSGRAGVRPSRPHDRASRR